MGHSADEVSYLIGDAFFIGDCVPVKGDIPIMVDEQDSRYTLERIESLSDLVDIVCERLKMPMLKMNPLFAKTIESMRNFE